MKKAIVTGATGYLGSVFVEYLMQRGVDVLALGRKEFTNVSSRRRKKLDGATYLRVDMAEIVSLPAKIQTLDWDCGEHCVFFNLAWGGVDRLSDLDVEAQMKNVAWSVAAVEAASKIGCSRFLQVGTMEEAFTYQYLELDHHRRSYYNRHVIYSTAKIAARYACRVRAKELGLDFIYVLHSHVMAPDDDKDSFLQVTLTKLVNKEELIFSTGEQYFDVISAKDCALGYFLICEKGLPGAEYWVGSGDPRRLREYVERMYRLYPSGQEMQFGKLAYNDIILDKNEFSIRSLSNDTGYQPTMTYEQTVVELYESLFPDHV